MRIVTGSDMASLDMLDRLYVGRKQGLEYLLEFAQNKAKKEIAKDPHLTVVGGPYVRVSVEYHMSEEDR